MNDILKDWCDFCEGNAFFEESHFLTLFHEYVGRDYLETVFQYFPNQDQLIQRMENVKSVMLNKRSEDINIDLVTALAIKDVHEKRKACVALCEDELVQVIDNVKPVFISEPKAFEKARYNEWHSEFRSQVGYHFNQNRVDEADKYYALFEAFYGVTNTYEMQWYLGKPLIKTDVNPDYYYDLWKIGGSYALTESELVITQK